MGVFKAIGSLKLELAAADDAAHLDPAALKKPEVIYTYSSLFNMG